jgi:hypothetical protein
MLVPAVMRLLGDSLRAFAFAPLLLGLAFGSSSWCHVVGWICRWVLKCENEILKNKRFVCAEFESKLNYLQPCGVLSHVTFQNEGVIPEAASHVMKA